MINIRDISIRCGRCNGYQTLTEFQRRNDWHVYTYQCENDICEPDQTRTLVEVPQSIDLFYRRHPDYDAPEDAP
jgi:hypothetical protein